MTPEEFYYWNQQFGNETDPDMDELFKNIPPQADVNHWCIKRDEWMPGHMKDCVVCRVSEYTEVPSMNPNYTHEDKMWLMQLGISPD